MAKVLGIVSFRIFPSLMGGQKGVALFYNYLQAHVQVLLAGSSDNEGSGVIAMERVLHTNRKIWRNLFRVGRLKRMVKEHEIDVVIAEHSYTGWLAWLLHRSTGRPFIIHSHNIESLRFREMKRWWWRWYGAYEGWIHRQAQHQFFISNEDRDYAIRNFKIAPALCTVITYGIERRHFNMNKIALRRSLELQVDGVLLLFNGTLDYEPNYEAVVILADEICPLLDGLLPEYTMVITGNRAPQWLLEKMESAPRIRYAGYVDDVQAYYCAADVFLNPVLNNTGIKTKLIEAIANHCTAVSTESGASGIVKEACGQKLVTIQDKDLNRFAGAVVRQLQNPPSDTPEAFYAQYDWKAIAAKAAHQIEELIRT